MVYARAVFTSPVVRWEHGMPIFSDSDPTDRERNTSEAAMEGGREGGRRERCASLARDDKMSDGRASVCGRRRAGPPSERADLAS